MMNKNKLKKAEKFVKDNIIDEYTWVHTQAIRPIAAKIADIEGGNKEIIDLAVLFHDIEKGKASLEKHAAKGAETAKKAMTKIGFDKEIIEKVVHCVAAHTAPWSKQGPMPETIEAKIIYDADMVQQVSPFGIIKYIHAFNDKKFNDLVKTGSDMMINKIPIGIFTSTAKKMIKERMPYVKDFFARAKE